uniref:FIT family protein n=1 Tax=Haemonchus contortus TaxID=6289 RepID=A0A7I5E5H7_HAECO
MNKDYPSVTTQRRQLLRSSVPNVVLGVTMQVARRFLFIDPKKKAVAFLAFVALLSLVSSFVTLDNSLYIVQKHSVFNQYGVKLGWMWTCFIVGPFIWFSSRAHHRDKDKSIIDLLRLAVATFCWYASIWQFHRLMQWTSRCDLSIRYSRTMCKEKGGVWIPGFDISGHCFLLIYSMLVMAEEANAFREWHQVVHRDDDCGIVMRERQEKRVKLAQYFVVAMLILNIIWIKQLAISILYYHIMIDKVAGALVAIFWWYTTYHILYPNGFLQPPIHRTKPVANRRR